jgi:two-component system, NtrC family, nitrogen regulation response regulator NtrX
VPAVNDRREDIALLATYFLEKVCNEYKMPVKDIDKDALEALAAHNWTGNVRELQNVMARLVILSSKTITSKDVQSFVTYN